jgi:hypothetical protein
MGLSIQVQLKKAPQTKTTTRTVLVVPFAFVSDSSFIQIFGWQATNGEEG